MTEEDYSRFADAAPHSSQLSDLSGAAREMFAAEAEVVECEERLARAKERLADITEKLIPDLMEDAGTSEVTLANGAKLKIEDKLTVRPLAENRPRVLDWLRATQGGAKIKRNVIVPLGKDADTREADLKKELRDAGFTDIQSKEWVESSTLTAHVRAALRDGKSVDMDLLNARLFKKAKITGMPKDGSSPFGD